jgi:glycosyltransferase involved in cell wall biosynthesis
MTTIVMTFYQRHKQLAKTLKSFEQYDPNDFNVVIVDDNSPDDIELEETPFETTILKFKKKNWINPAPVFNTGFVHALRNKPDNVIIQNAECYHNGDILGYIKNNLTDNNYLSFGCYSLGKGEDVDLKVLNNRIATSNGDSAWYNHSVYRPEAFHFCCAITAKNLIKINGFDERFTMGLGYEDNYLIHQIKCLGLNIKIVDNPFVFHQYHYDIKAFNFDDGLYVATEALYKDLIKKKNYRAEHFLTPDFDALDSR